VKLLFLTPQRPHPPRQGTALRNWGLISHLADRGHAITLLTFDEGDAPLSPELAQACARIVRLPAPTRTVAQRVRTLAGSALPDMAWRLWSEAFRDALRDIVRDEDPDVIQIEGIELARYAFELPTTRARVVFDDHNCEYLLQQRAFETDIRRPRRWHAALYSRVQAGRLRAFERRVIVRADATLCVSEQDRAMLLALTPDRPADVIYNGIDVAAYGGEAAAAASPPVILYTGKMDFRPNIDAALWFAQAVLPRVLAGRPDARFVIVGQKPGPRLDPLRAHPSIEIVGAVDDIRPSIRSATVYVAPLLAGGGTRFKLLEAMAMRKAIVSTPLGAEGFAVTSGREMALADAPAAFADAVLALIRDAARRETMGAAAHAFVSGTYDWRAIVPRLEAVYARIAHGAPR
jgi:glycosyltransferase involved in cell wall biosynthesis